MQRPHFTLLQISGRLFEFQTMKRVRGALRLFTTGNKNAQEIESNGSPKPFDAMPGPKPLPLIKNLWRYLPVIGEFNLKRIHRTYSKLYEKYGPIVREDVYGNRQIVHVYDPDDMENVYINGGRLPIRLSHRILAKYRKERPEKYSCPGLFPSNGEEWYKFRQLFQKNLMAVDTGEVCASDLETITEDLVTLISAKLDERLELDLQPLLFKWALECIGVIAVNRRLGCLNDNENKEVLALIEAVQNTSEAVYRTEMLPLRHKKYYKILTESQDYVSSVVEKYLDDAMEEIRHGKHPDSVLGRMMNAKGVSRKDIFTMILDMFLAGIDTTAFTVGFAFYNLAQNPDVQDKLRHDLMELLPEKHSRVRDVRFRVPYLQRFIKETLRVSPISIGTGRITPCDLVLSGYKVPAKTMVILQHQVSSKLERYCPDAHILCPDRPDILPAVSRPFGHGPRMCIGFRIARKEIILALARVVRNFKISYHHEEIGTYNRLINVPDKPLLLRFESVLR